MRIAILGTRGIPARYGGFETFAEELSTRLAARGHTVTVYCRPVTEDVGPLYRGVHRRTLPIVRNKYLETPLHALLSLLDIVWRGGFDAVLLCNAANTPFCWLAWLRGLPVLVNVDGIERKRAKWSAVGKLWYRVGEVCSVLLATRVIADAEVIAEYYRDTYRRESEVIAYGATAIRRPAGAVLQEFGLTPGRYLLYVSRLEPENHALTVIRAYGRSRRDVPLVIVGDAPYAAAYKEQLRAEAGPGVIFTGFQFGAAYQELQSHALLYIQATEVGGTHPALIESMAYGNFIIANDTPENREVLGECGAFYARNDPAALSALIDDWVAREGARRECGDRARQCAAERYSWDRIADQYEALFHQVVPGGSQGVAPVTGSQTTPGVNP